MRGTIIMWSGDKGVVAAGSQRYDFDIGHWQGNTAPAANMSVEIATADGRLTGLAPVSEADLAREKLAAMTGEGSKFAKAIFADVGRDVAIGYGAFFIIAMFVSLISTGGFVDIRITLADLLSGDMARAALSGSSGKGTLLVLLATATIAVPYFWKHKFATLIFTVPLLFTVLGFWPLYKQHRARQQAMEAMGEFGQMMGQMAEQMGGGASGPFDSLGIGAWLLFAIVIFLAFSGVMRSLARA
jgi:hypothetical protein